MSKEDFFNAPVLYPTLSTASTQPSPPSAIALEPRSPFTSIPYSQPVIHSPSQNSNTCAKCSQQVSTPAQNKGSVFVVLSCKHTMHASCFVKTVTEQGLVDSCDNDFGGAKQCSRCFDSIPSGLASVEINDRRKVLAEFRSSFTAQYKVNWSEGLRESALTPEEIRAILGITLSMFSSDKTDYSLYGRQNNRSSEELVMELISRGRTIDVIFASQQMKLDVHHLYRFGIQTMEQLVRLGYNALKHGDAAHREKCPYWLLSELYGFSSDNLLDDITPNALLSKALKPSELWLCGVSMQNLVDRGLSKQKLLAYRGNIVDMINYLDLTHAHLNKLEIKQSDWPPAWREYVKSDARVATLFKHIRL